MTPTATGGTPRRVLVVAGDPRAVDAVRAAWPSSTVVGSGRSADRSQAPGPRRLARAVDRFDPDLVVTASVAAARDVDRLRARHGFIAPTAAVTEDGTVTPVTAAEGDRSGRRGCPVRRQDALFVYTDTDTVAQQLGVLFVAGPTEDGSELTAQRLRTAIADSVAGMMTLHRRLVWRGRWRRPAWAHVPDVPVADHVHEVSVTGPDREAEAHQVVEDFWSRRLPDDRPPWQMLVIRGLGDGRTLVPMKMHHALADGLSAFGLLERLFRPAGEGRDSAGDGAGDGAHRLPARQVLANTALVGRGLWHLARGGFAPRTRLDGEIGDLRRSLAFASFPGERLRATARAWRVRRSDLVIAGVAEALSRIDAGGGGRRLRMMVPVTLRPLTETRTYGNWTGALGVTVGLEPVSPGERLAEVRETLRRTAARGEPQAATVVLRALGLLPPPLHRAIARLVYGRRFFTMVVSYLPGGREPLTLAGTPVLAMYPVMGLAEDVRVALGVVAWGDTTSIGVIADRQIASDAQKLAAAVEAALADYAAAAGVE